MIRSFCRFTFPFYQLFTQDFYPKICRRKSQMVNGLEWTILDPNTLRKPGEMPCPPLALQLRCKCWRVPLNWRH